MRATSLSDMEGKGDGGSGGSGISGALSVPQLVRKIKKHRQMENDKRLVFHLVSFFCILYQHITRLIYFSNVAENNYRELYAKKEICQTKNLIRVDLIPDFHAILQSLPQFPPTISYLFPLACTHLRVTVDARTDRGEPPPRLAQRPVAQSAVE